MRMATLGKGEMILKLAGTGRLLWVSFTPRPQELARLQGPVPKPPDPPAEQRRSRWGLGIDKIPQEWWINLKHEDCGHTEEILCEHMEQTASLES